MKKLIVILVVLAPAGVAARRSRIELLVRGIPRMREILSPISPNEPTAWAKGPEVADAPPDERSPYVILILIDGMGFNDISLHNGGAADGTLQTPNIDAVAHDSGTFTNGYGASAVCSPSRASILTGRYCARLGCEFIAFPKVRATISEWMQEIAQPVLPTCIDQEKVAALPAVSKPGMPPEEITIAGVMHGAGYYTAHIGKWHLGGTNGMRPEDQGFEDRPYLSGAFCLPGEDPGVVNAKREESSVERMVWAQAQYSAQFNSSECFQPAGYLTDYCTDEALEVIENNRNRPLFLCLAHWGTHNPLQAKREDYDALANIQDHHLRVYAAMIGAVDRSVGRISAKLAELGLAENTLVLPTSDNGSTGYIQLPDIDKPFRGWKLTHFEGGAHVPFMAKRPARVTPHSVLDAAVHHVDLYHTVAAVGGARVPADRELDGVDLLPFVTGERTGLPHATLFRRGGHHQAVQHLGWKLIRAARPGKRWLFDLAEDPTGHVNLAQSHPAKVCELEALLKARNAEQAEPMWPSLLAAPQLIDKHAGQPYEEGDEYIYWPNQASVAGPFI